MNLHNDTWAAESAIGYFHHEERGKPTIFWNNLKSMEFYVQCPRFSLAMQAMNETLLIFPNSGISNSLSPPLSPHTKLDGQW